MTTGPRRYYNQRAGELAGQRPRFTVRQAWAQLVAIYRGCEAEGWFQEAFGKDCVDSDGRLGGYVRGDVAMYVARRTLLSGIWPLQKDFPDVTLPALFTMIEFLWDHVSQPINGWYHNFDACGFHAEQFDAEAGRDEWRRVMNEFLPFVEDGYEMSATGEIQLYGDEAQRALWNTPIPVSADSDAVEAKISRAVRRFRHALATAEERRDAVRDLADALEFLRPAAKQHLLRKDEAALFELANKFGIRHNDANQQRDYEPDLWLDWMFHTYLATCHLLLGLSARGRESVRHGRAEPSSA